MESEAEVILGMGLSQYLEEIDRLKAEGLKKLGQALVESGFFTATQTQATGDKNEG